MIMIQEIKRRKGYYLIDGLNKPSVSKCTSAIGDPNGLLRYGVNCGSIGVIWGLSKIKDLRSLKDKLESPSAVNWAKEQGVKCYESEMERVTTFGKVQHEAVEILAKGGDMSNIDTSTWDVGAKEAINTISSFIDDIGIKFMHAEKVVFSRKFGYGGQLDLSSKLTSEICEKLKPYLMKKSYIPQAVKIVADLKTGSFYERKHAMQLSAYRQAYNEMYPEDPIHGGLIINVQRENPKEAQCFYYNSDSLNAAFHKGFLVGKLAWEWLEAPDWYRKQEGIIL